MSFILVYSVYFHLVYYHVFIIACHFISSSYISVFDINCCISHILKFRLDLIQYSIVGRIVYCKMLAY